MITPESPWIKPDQQDGQAHGLHYSECFYLNTVPPLSQGHWMK